MEVKAAAMYGNPKRSIFFSIRKSISIFNFAKISGSRATNEKIDAAILPLPTAVLSLAKEQYQSLDIVGKIDEKVSVSIGVLKDKPILKQILFKNLLSVVTTKKQEILSKWTNKLNYVEKIDYQLTYLVAGLLGMLFFSMSFYAYGIRKKHAYEKELTQKMEILALTDDLTGLQNKRAFNLDFESEHADKFLLGLLFVDVDDFKRYNDCYGHLKGDIILQKIANLMSEFSSNNVHLYRIGGEEFGFILYDYEIEDAIECADKICKKIYNMHIEHKGSPLGYISVSIGVSVGEVDINRHTLYQDADKALYIAKSSGKNRVFMNQ